MSRTCVCVCVFGCSALAYRYGCTKGTALSQTTGCTACTLNDVRFCGVTRNLVSLLMCVHVEHMESRSKLFLPLFSTPIVLFRLFWQGQAVLCLSKTVECFSLTWGKWNDLLLVNATVYSWNTYLSVKGNILLGWDQWQVSCFSFNIWCGL